MLNVREHDENIVFKCITQEFSSKDVEDIKDLIKVKPQKSVIVNLSGVSKIKNTSLKLLKKIAEQNRVSLCNLESDVYAAINLLNYDKIFSVYIDESSSINKNAELINRRFKIV